MKTEQTTYERTVYSDAQIIPLAIYIFGISAAMMYVLCRSHMALYTALMTAIAWGTAFGFNAIKRIKFVPLASIAFVGLAGYTLLHIYPMGGKEGFAEFVFTSSSFFKTEYAVVAAALFGLIVGFTVCFFSAYSPRPALLILPSFIPLILSSRTAGGLPEWIVIIIAAGYIMSVAGLPRALPPSTVRFESAANAKRQRLAAILIMGAAAALMLAVLPRSEKTPLAQVLDEIAPPAGGYRASGLTDFASKSSVNTGANDTEGNLLFTAQADSPVLLTKMYFDEYNGADGWTKGEERLGYPDWQTAEYYANCARLVGKIKNALDYGLLSEYKDAFSQLEYSTDGKEVCYGGYEHSPEITISSKDGSSVRAIIHPEHTWYVAAPDNVITYRTEIGEIFTKDAMPQYSEYMVSFWNDKPNESFINALESTSYYALLTDALNEEVISSAEFDALTNEWLAARDYGNTYNRSSGGISNEIVLLAAQITDGLDNDYEKALAIEKWFGDAGFVYDKEFVPKRFEADYFIFKSQRGICSDFATAAVLLARAAGLTAKYAEGYALSESIRGEDGLFYVTDEQAHAYALVYIEGYGWLDIDGTRYVQIADNTHSNYNVAVLVIVLAGAALAVVCVVFRGKLREWAFRAAFPFRGRRGQMISLYKALRAMTCKISGASEQSVTVGEVCQTVSGALGLPEEGQRLKAAFDEFFYGESGAENIDPKTLYADYKSALKAKRRRGR